MELCEVMYYRSEMRLGRVDPNSQNRISGRLALQRLAISIGNARICSKIRVVVALYHKPVLVQDISLQFLDRFKSALLQGMPEKGGLILSEIIS